MNRSGRSEYARFGSTAVAVGDVLVVDANPDVRELYREVLKAAGLAVSTAADGRDALAHALRLRPRVALVDEQIPFINGIELCGLLRADPLTEATRVILVTTDPALEHAELCQKQGAAAVLLKPLRVEFLAATIREWETREVKPPQRDGAYSARGPERDGQGRAFTPPQLFCPDCDAALHYDRSHMGGVSERQPEQWDYFVCQKHGLFQYRHRTRRLRRIT